MIPGTVNDLVPWDEARLLRLIQDRTEERFDLEYKGAKALAKDNKSKEEITKDVSAMANSGGGTVIYGLTEFSDALRKHLPERIDPIDRTEFPKEWLDQIVGQIRPRIPDLQIHPVQLRTQPNEVAYVVEIPQGATAHQALTLKYYRRYNFESVPMLDHEIRDVMNRRSHPKIEVSARLIIYPHATLAGVAGRLIYKLKNDSDVLARYVVLIAFAPIKINGHPVSYVGENIILDETKNGRAYKLAWSNHNSAPFFPRTSLEFSFDFKVGSNLKVRGTKPLAVLYQHSVFADAMPALRGQLTFDEINVKDDNSGTEPWVDASSLE